ncbi:DUF4363 family protein [Symbiobacterium terraclitae]|uniref:DUF4363 family protein n=1 Tax=Symbiobacterium terraclitae TaxID=557451 RepID=UPI0035B56B34
MNARMRQLIYIGLPVVIVTVTVLLFNMGGILKRSFGADDDVAGRLNQLLSLTQQRDWDRAHTTIDDVSQAWQRVRGRIHITSTTDEIELFDLELAGLRGAVDTRDEVQANIAVRRLIALWEDIGV